MNVLNEALKLIRTPFMRKYIRDNGIIDKEGWFPPVDMHEISEEEFDKREREWADHMTVKRPKVALK